MSCWFHVLSLTNAGLIRCGRFYYADQRKADGTAIYRVDGEAHARLYWKLAEEQTHGPWMQTFVKDEGYVKFESQYV